MSILFITYSHSDMVHPYVETVPWKKLPHLSLKNQISAAYNIRTILYFSELTEMAIF